MRNSIRFKITFLLTALIVFTIFMTWFINRTFLPKYYLHSKVKTLAEVYGDVQNIYKNNKNEEDVYLSDEDTLKVDRLSSVSNVNIYVLMQFAHKSQLNYPKPSSIFEGNKVRDWFIQLADQVQQMMMAKDSNVTVIRLVEDKYVIFKYYDSHSNINYIYLIGNIGSDKTIFLQSNFESITESAAIANQFLAYIGSVAVVLGIAAMLFISRRFTKPILELSEIAKKMTDLDFEAKYKVRSKDEIGTLGNSINTLSDKLKSTVLELKTANNELMTDIQKKTEIDEMRQEFLSNVSHELKTPISLIQGYAEGLKENITEDEESRNFYCEVIMDEAGKMNKMVKKLLTLNELESGRNQVNFERFDLVELIRSVLETTNILFKQKKVTVHFDEKEPAYVWADEFMVEQVMTNYVSNAVNHVSGQNIIEVKLIRHGDVIRVAVFNTGDNIPEEDINKIWDKFYKVDKARTREYGGSGIGLSIVKAIMNSLNRECGVINHPTGVEFWFELDTKS